MSKRAIILAGGKGTRLKPYTNTFPKPLVPVGDMPILEIIIKQLASYGFNNITITVNHLAELIETFFKDGSKWGVKIKYSFEDKPLSTMGPLKLIKDLPNNFLVMNGDVLTDLDFEQFYNYHVAQAASFTISSFKRKQDIDYGVLETDNNEFLIKFKEKPTIPFNVSMGVYMVNKSVLELLPNNEPFGFDDLMIKMIKKKMFPSTLTHDGYWLDIGRPDDYEKACNEIDTIVKRL